MSDVFYIQNGQKQKELEVIGTHQLLVYVVDANVKGGDCKYQKTGKHEALFDTSQEIDSEVSAERIKHMFLQHNQSAG